MEYNADRLTWNVDDTFTVDNMTLQSVSNWMNNAVDDAMFTSNVTTRSLYMMHEQATTNTIPTLTFDQQGTATNAHVSGYTRFSFPDIQTGYGISDATTGRIIIEASDFGTTAGVHTILYTPTQLSKAEALRHKIRNQMQPDLTKLFGKMPRSWHKGCTYRDTKANEIVALQLLRSMVGRDQFKRYLKHGFITVEGPSGLMYQVRRKSHNIVVWDQGVKLASLCVYLRDQTIPPTDEVVAKMLICECDEPDIWKRANVSWMQSQHQQHPAIAGLGIPVGNQGGVRIGNNDFYVVAA